MTDIERGFFIFGFGALSGFIFAFWVIHAIVDFTARKKGLLSALFGAIIGWLFYKTYKDDDKKNERVGRIH
jgi:hypothetical protein